jgi:hypothetical protein
MLIAFCITHNTKEIYMDVVAKCKIHGALSIYSR